MELFLNGIQFWHWLVLGIVLIVFEIFVPSAIFLWPGVAALFTGVIAYIFPASWPVLLLVWALFSVVLAFGWQFYKKKKPSSISPMSTMNRRGEQYVGRHFTLNKDIVNGYGELHVDDTRWKIVSHHDLTAGTKVKVIAVEGTAFRVEEFIS